MLTHIICAILLITLMLCVIYESHLKQKYKNHRRKAVEQGQDPNKVVKPKLIFDYFI